MTSYPDGHPGVWPVDPTTPVGQIRNVIGDYNAVEYTPPEPGYRDFAAFSDAELEALLAMALDSTPRAVGYAYLKIAGLAANESVEWASDDLRLNLARRASELREIATAWFDIADSSLSGEDYFEIVSTGKEPEPWPEAATRVWLW
jgi:hypothetical protein